MTATRLLLVAAGLMGAAGVALAALASHAYAGTSLATGATMLSLHAPAIIAVAIGGKTGILHDPTSRIAAWALAAGTLLFSGDLALRSMAGIGLFPMAAPIGGMAMIAAWMGVALAGAIRSLPES